MDHAGVTGSRSVASTQKTASPPSPPSAWWRERASPLCNLPRRAPRGRPPLNSRQAAAVVPSALLPPFTAPQPEHPPLHLPLWRTPSVCVPHGRGWQRDAYWLHPVARLVLVLSPAPCPSPPPSLTPVGVRTGSGSSGGGGGSGSRSGSSRGGGWRARTAVGGRLVRRGRRGRPGGRAAMAASGARLAAATRLARHVVVGGRASRGGATGGGGGGGGSRRGIPLPGGCVLSRTGGRARAGGSGGSSGIGGGGGGGAVGVGAVAAATVGGVRHSAAGATHPPRPVNERCLEYRPGSSEVTVRFGSGGAGGRGEEPQGSLAQGGRVAGGGGDGAGRGWNGGVGERRRRAGAASPGWGACPQGARLPSPQTAAAAARRHPQLV